MSVRTPPIVRTVVTAYRDVVRVLTSMPSLVFVTLLVLLGCNVAEQRIMPADARGSWTGDLVTFAVQVVSTFLMTPFLIAVHRFILLGEITASYRLEPRQPRLLRFFGWSVALSAIALIPDLLLRAASPESLVNIGLIVVSFIATVFVTVRLTLLFPAIAVDAPGAADYLLAFSDTRGHVWRIVFIFVLALLPFVGVTIVLAFGGWLP